jgi:16S rRNA (guanine1207-N2)-methyltransferase
VDNPPTGHYFEASPTARSSRRTIPLVLPDLAVDLVTDRGVFSAARVDPGTRFLLLEAPRPTAEMADVLDVGCGYGPVTVALARRSPSTRVWAVDVNDRAVSLTAENATRLSLDNVHAVDPSDVPDDVSFDAIWSNPPIRIGKGQLHELLSQWLGRLRDEGHAYFVVQRNLGADSLQRWFETDGWSATRIGSRAGYRLLDVTRGSTR